MFEKTREELNGMLQVPFTYRDHTGADFWRGFCTVTLCVRYVYMKLPILLKFFIGSPLFLFSFNVFVAYFLFVTWSLVLDTLYHYDFSEQTFSIRRYFKIYFLKNILFFMVAFFMYEYYFFKFGWLCFIYSIPMLFISIGYVLPIFDKRIYKQ